jgi:hypothetical protein
VREGVRCCRDGVRRRGTPRDAPRHTSGRGRRCHRRDTLCARCVTFSRVRVLGGAASERCNGDASDPTRRGHRHVGARLRLFVRTGREYVLTPRGSLCAVPPAPTPAPARVARTELHACVAVSAAPRAAAILTSGGGAQCTLPAAAACSSSPLESCHQTSRRIRSLCSLASRASRHRP